MRQIKNITILSVNIVLILISSTVQLKAEITEVYKEFDIDNSVVVISGTIIDVNKEPIASAVISVMGSGVGTYSDESGLFTIEVPKDLKVDLKISSIGYIDKSVEVDIEGKREVTINATLSRSVTNLSEVVVEGLNRSKQIEQRGYNATSVDTKVLQLQTVELNAVLNKIPGIKVRTDGGLGAKTTYNINGLSGNAIRFFIDGVPMEYFGSAYSINSIPVSLIDRVDVYKGVVPVELGNDALGGAVNVVTKRDAKSGINAAYSVGSFNTHRASIAANFREASSGLTARLSGYYNYSDNSYKVWGDDISVVDDDITSPTYGQITRGLKVNRFHDSYSSQGAKIDLGFTGKTWADQLLLGFLYADMDKDIQHGATMEVPYGERVVSEMVYMPSVTYSKNSLFTDNLNLNLFAAYSSSLRDLTDTTSVSYNWFGEVINEANPQAGEASTTPTLNSSEDNTYIGRANIYYQINGNSSIGVNYLHTDFSRVSDDPLASPEARAFGDRDNMIKRVAGVNYQLKALDQKLIGSLFFKYYGQSVEAIKSEYESDVYIPYNFSSSSSNYGYGASAIYHYTPSIKVNFSIEKALRLPEIDELFGNTAENIVGTDNLKPEQSNNVNLGFIIKALDKNRHRVDTKIDLFYRDTKDKLRQAMTTGSDDMFMYENLDETLSMGVDASVDYNYNHRLSVTVQGSYLDSRFKAEFDEQGNRNLHYNAREKNMPYLTADLFLRYKWDNVIQDRSNLKLSVGGSYVHEFYRFWETYGSQGKDMVPSQTSMDVSLGYTFPNKKFSLGFDANNILDEQLFDNFAIQKPGRAFYTKLSMRL